MATYEENREARIRASAEAELDLEIRAQNYISGAARHFGRVARVTSGTDAQVILQNTGPAIAWTTMQSDINLNKSVLMPSITNAIAYNSQQDLQHIASSLVGVINHELCHLLYSPSATSLLVKTLKSYHDDSTKPYCGFVARAWNILEDMRIESLYVARFRIFKLHFSHMVAKWIVEDGGSASGNWLLLTARNYLPEALRSSARAEFVAAYGEPVAARADDLAQRFKRLRFTGRQNATLVSEAMDIIVAYAELIHGCSPMLDSSTSHETFASSGRGTTTDRQIIEESDGELAESDDETVDDMIGSTGNGTDDDASADADCDSDANDDADGDSDAYAADDDDVDGDDDASGGSAGKSGKSDDYSAGSLDADVDGNGVGGGSDASKDTKSKTDSFSEALNTLDKIESDDSFVADVNSTVDDITLNGDSGSVADRLPIARLDYELDSQTTHEAQTSVRDLVRYISRLRNELEPANESGHRNGRLNMRNAIKRMAFDQADIDIFDKFIPGRDDEVSMDVAVLIDMSSSMRDNSALASAAGWSIKMACHKLDLPCVIVKFNSYSQLVWDYNERPTPKPVSIYAGGNTDPSGGLAASISFFNRRGANRIQACFIVTDGQWFNIHKSEAAIRAMNEMGVYTCLFGLDDAVRLNGSHDCTQAEDCKSVSDLAPFMDVVIHNLTKRVVMAEMD